MTCRKRSTASRRASRPRASSITPATAGYRGINVDLIYGLPLQTPQSFERTVDSVIALGPDRAAVYSFAFVPWVKGSQKKIEEDQLPAPDVKVQLFAIARERFLAAGYEPIGMDHFARPDDELAIARREGRLRRNFQGYAVIPGDDVVGLGISAIGDVRGSYVQNEKKLSTYEEAIAAGKLPVVRGVAPLDRRRDPPHRHPRADVQLRRRDARDIERRYGIDFARYFADDLRAARAARARRDGAGVARAHRGDADRRAVRAQPGDVLRPLPAREARRRCEAGVQPHGVSMARLVVVGGGIAGLAAAWSARCAAARAGVALDVLVLERDGEVGGKARTIVRDGWMVEGGPSGFLGGREELDALLRAGGLADDVVQARAAAKRRFVYRGARLREIKASPLGFARIGHHERRAGSPVLPRNRS